jgi:hypothetical protein
LCRLGNDFGTLALSFAYHGNHLDTGKDDIGSRR